MASSDTLDVVLVAPDPTPYAGLVMRLRAANHRIWEMRDCGSALAFLLDNNADVVIVDSALKGIRGLEIVPLLKKIRPVARVITVVDEGSLADLRQVLDSGIYCHSFKPFDQGRILEAICRVRKNEDLTSEGSKNG